MYYLKNVSNNGEYTAIEIDTTTKVSKNKVLETFVLLFNWYYIDQNNEFYAFLKTISYIQQIFARIL